MEDEGGKRGGNKNTTHPQSLTDNSVLVEWKPEGGQTGMESAKLLVGQQGILLNIASYRYVKELPRAVGSCWEGTWTDTTPAQNDRFPASPSTTVRS